MALQLRQSLKLAQQLIMTPQLQQAIKLLQQSRLELLETIQQEMEINPLLEEQLQDEVEEGKAADEGEDKKVEEIIPEVTVKENAREDVDWDNYLSEYNTSGAEPSYEGKDTPSFENFISHKTNLHTHLLWQLHMNDFDDIQKEIGAHIIGNLNDHGYLKITPDEISQATGSPFEKIIETLKIIQNWDPVGVAARDTRECLLIQATFNGLGGTLVERILQDHMDKLENRRYDLIAKSLSVPLQDIITAASIITNFNPKPGLQYLDEDTVYVSPDIYVYKIGDDFEIVLNEDGLPKLRINRYYRRILSNDGSLKDDTRGYIQDKLNSAAWLIKSIHQRQRTIYRVTESIVKFQKAFFNEGVANLRPLVLRDVADDIEMHESTVSRVTTNKYVHTPQGIFELKFFFNSAINSIEGDPIASESVKTHIKKIIMSENIKKPYSDLEVAEILKKLNIKIARRTVAKYRETLGILSSVKRKNPY